MLYAFLTFTIRATVSHPPHPNTYRVKLRRFLT